VHRSGQHWKCLYPSWFIWEENSVFFFKSNVSIGHVVPSDFPDQQVKVFPD
jgi:hypothetical protein